MKIIVKNSSLTFQKQIEISENLFDNAVSVEEAEAAAGQVYYYPGAVTSAHIIKSRQDARSANPDLMVSAVISVNVGDRFVFSGSIKTSFDNIGFISGWGEAASHEVECISSNWKMIVLPVNESFSYTNHVFEIT